MRFLCFGKKLCVHRPPPRGCRARHPGDSRADTAPKTTHTSAARESVHPRGQSGICLHRADRARCTRRRARRAGRRRASRLFACAFTSAVYLHPVPRMRKRGHAAMLSGFRRLAPHARRRGVSTALVHVLYYQSAVNAQRLSRHKGCTVCKKKHCLSNLTRASNVT